MKILIFLLLWAVAVFIDFLVGLVFSWTGASYLIIAALPLAGCFYLLERVQSLERERADLAAKQAEREAEAAAKRQAREARKQERLEQEMLDLVVADEVKSGTGE